MDCVLFHVKFEYGVSIPALRNKATQYRTMESKIEEVSKRVN